LYEKGNFKEKKPEIDKKCLQMKRKEEKIKIFYCGQLFH